jgi:hypothetical protein
MKRIDRVEKGIVVISGILIKKLEENLEELNE